MENYHDIIINLTNFLTLEEFYSFIGCSKSMITVPKEYSLLILNSYFPNWETDDFYDENCINGLNNLYQLKRECSRYNLGEKSEYILNRRNDKYMIIPIFEKYKDLCRNNESTKYYSDEEALDCIKSDESSSEYYSDNEILNLIENNKYAYNIKPRDGDMYIFLNDEGKCTEEWYYFEEEDIFIEKSDKNQYFYWPVFPMGYYGFGEWKKDNIKFIFDDDMIEELHKNSNDKYKTKLNFNGEDIYFQWDLMRGDPHSTSQYIDMINQDFPFYLKDGPNGVYYKIVN